MRGVCGAVSNTSMPIEANTASKASANVASRSRTSRVKRCPAVSRWRRQCGDRADAALLESAPCPSSDSLSRAGQSAPPRHAGSTDHRAAWAGTTCSRSDADATQKRAIRRGRSAFGRIRASADSNVWSVQPIRGLGLPRTRKSSYSGTRLPYCAGPRSGPRRGAGSGRPAHVPARARCTCRGVHSLGDS